MIRCIDAMEHVDDLFSGNTLDMPGWEAYMGKLYPDAVRMLKDDVQSYLQSGGYTFEKDFLPVIAAVRLH